MTMTNLAAAHTAQALASAAARSVEGDLLPLPPAGLPALRSIPGPDAMHRALVLGYHVVQQTVHDIIGPDGRVRVPGDEGFLAAVYGRLKVSPMPSGWRSQARETMMLVAIVDGCPILLEAAARELGYSRALATGPSVLKLGEIPEEICPDA